jgi:thiamine-monophosphate kinase
MAESTFLEHLRRTSVADARVPIGIGDDLAAIAWNSSDLLLIGADQVLDGVHFDSSVHSPREIGRKAMLRNLSDCAAMACVPVAAVVTLALPRGSGEALAIDLMEGIRSAAMAFKCAIVGGDTGSWTHPLAVTVTILGRSAGLAPVQRSGARPGDKLFVTGPLGGSILGRHMNIVPRVDLAIELAARYELHAMLDLSDGLSRDLPRLCQASGVGAVIDATKLPIHEDARRMLDSRTPLSHAMEDGEDHELLFATPSCDHPHVIEIGECIADGSMWLRDGESMTPLTVGGWDHEL